MNDPDAAATTTDATAFDPDSVLHAIGEARVTRYLEPREVPSELIDQLLWAATRASNPSNSQLWHFVVVTDPDRRRQVAEAVAPFEERLAQLPAPADEREARARRATLHLARGLADVPVLIAVCATNGYPATQPDDKYLWATLGGAAQNLLVAARALGLGAALTRYHIVDEAAVAEILGLPDEVTLGWLVPVGWPQGGFGPVRRRPMHEVTHRDRWGA